MASCKLVIKDEVNVKIEGLDLHARKKLVNMFKFEIPGARYMPAVRLGRWDGTISFFQLGGSTYINLLEEIIPVLTSEGYDIEIDDVRDYSTKFEFAQITEDSYADRTWPKGHPMEGQPIRLRDYQIGIINTFLENPQSIQEVATGAGKTIMTAALSQSVEHLGRSIVIVPNKDLVKQTEADYINMGLDVGVYFGDRKEFGRHHTICTWQSLNVLMKATRNSDVEITIHEFIEGVVCIMVDEVHMAKADALKTLLTSVFARVPIRWGLTGTIPKEKYEQVSLLCSLGIVTGKLTASELQDAGHLAQCNVNIVQLLDNVDYQNYQSELKYLVETDSRLEYIASLVARVNETGNTLVLVDRIAAGKLLASKIENSVFVSGATKANDRKSEYDEVATAEGKIIIATYGVAAVGINIPRIFNLVLLEPGKSFVRVIQSIGRGIRKAQDKDSVEIWDITSNCKFAKRHLNKRKQFYREANYPFNLEKVEWR
jgi:superfamily II DNA or RNA helicase